MRVRSLVSIVVMTLSGSAAVFASERTPMTAVDLIGIALQREVRLAPDGSQALFVRTTADWKEDRAIGHIWRVRADGGEPVQMTNGADGEGAPTWSPDGRKFAFAAKRDGEHAQVWLQAVDGGEAICLTKLESSASDLAWSPDGATIFFLAEDPPSKEEKELDERIGGAYSYDRDFRHEHLWAADVATGAARRVIGGELSVLGYRLSRDGSRLVYHAAPTPLFDDHDEGEVWVRDLAGGEARRLTTNAVAESVAELSPDGAEVLFVADADAAFNPYYQGRIFVVAATGGEARPLLEGFDHEVLSARWSADGRHVVFLANLGVTTQLHRVEVETGAIARLTDGEHDIVGWDLRPESGSIAFVAQRADSPGDVWLLPLTGEARLVTSFGEEVQARFRFPRTEIVRWAGRDGVEVEGILSYPLDWTPGTRVPLVIQTHGGPAASSTLRFPRWPTYVPVLAAKGYAVLDPNYRGSTGYGDAFLRDMVGHYFNQADDDVLAGADAMIARGLADPDRLATMGWSAGGHMTNWLVTQTDRFAAASSGAGASNWISMYGQSDVRTYRTPWFGGTPWQEGAPIATYLEHSPVSHVAKATTPTLILVGEDDVRVPMAQSVEMLRALRASGVETELVVFPAQPHGLRRLKHQLHKINVEIGWFERHLHGREHEAERPPDTKE